MSYTTNITIRLAYSPVLAEIAAKIGKALDPDVGGDKSFQRDILGYSGDTPVYADTISTSAPCTDEFKAQAEYMTTNPAALHAAVSADYATRWGDLTPPTLAECEAFCAGIIPAPTAT